MRIFYETQKIHLIWKWWKGKVSIFNGTDGSCYLLETCPSLFPLHIMKLTHGLIVMCLIMCITHPPPPKKLQLFNNLTLQKDKTYLGSCDVEFSKLCLKVTVHLQLQKSLIKFYLHFEVFTQLFSNACISWKTLSI